MQFIGCTYHQLKYSSPNRSNKTKQEPHKRAYLSENGGLGKNRSGEWPKSRKGKERNSDRTRQKNKRGDIEKWDQTESPEIPDRGEETSEIPGLPSGGVKKKLKEKEEGPAVKTRCGRLPSLGAEIRGG
jgi:hypothetical protein